MHEPPRSATGEEKYKVYLLIYNLYLYYIRPNTILLTPARNEQYNIRNCFWCMEKCSAIFNQRMFYTVF